MNCKEYRELIEDALDISLHGDPEKRVKLHLEHCDACRAYFHIPAISGNAQMARRFVMNFGEGDEATGIIEVTANQKSTPACGIYTLDGRKLQGQPTQRGIYIVNGKKIIVK